jgi:hypothetical protein
MEELIHNKQIPADKAISLMKDSNYTNQIVHNLIEANRNSLKAEAKDETEAQHLISLDEDELGQVLDSVEEKIK